MTMRLNGLVKLFVLAPQLPQHVPRRIVEHADAPGLPPVVRSPVTLRPQMSPRCIVEPPAAPAPPPVGRSPVPLNPGGGCSHTERDVVHMSSVASEPTSRTKTPEQ